MTEELVEWAVEHFNFDNTCTAGIRLYDDELTARHVAAVCNDGGRACQVLRRTVTFGDWETE